MMESCSHPGGCGRQRHFEEPHPFSGEWRSGGDGALIRELNLSGRNLRELQPDLRLTLLRPGGDLDPAFFAGEFTGSSTANHHLTRKPTGKHPAPLSGIFFRRSLSLLKILPQKRKKVKKARMQDLLFFRFCGII
jgi:hypothetical protein